MRVTFDLQTGRPTGPVTWWTRAEIVVAAPTPGTVLYDWQDLTIRSAMDEDVPANTCSERLHSRRNLDAHP